MHGYTERDLFGWLNQLVNIEIPYITGRNSIVITDIDVDVEKRLLVQRGNEVLSIKLDRVLFAFDSLLKGTPVHIDSLFHSGSNDRSVIETILIALPPVGYMKRKTGRNKINYKVIQMLNKDVHQIGVCLDISDMEFESLVISLDANSRGRALNPVSKPFLLLAGISGTGKSRYVRKQAEASAAGKSNFELVSVRPDWHEPSDLLGYVSRLSSEGAEYVVTNVLKFMVQAWLDIIESVDEHGWTAKPLDQISPFWLCLDEMNLAPVEQYFADYLSVIETRQWQDGEYRCEPLLKKDVFEQLKKPALTKLQQELGLTDQSDLWQYFINHGIAIPFNLIVAGTVNMDETTHGFSRKVIDRALSFDFGEFFPNDINEFFNETLTPKILSYPVYSHATLELFNEVAADNDAAKTKAFFNAINSVLKNTQFELAYRALNELCLAVISFAPTNESELAAVFDDFLMCKVLPRIEGDDDKLVGNNSENLLELLSAVLATQLSAIWELERPDLLRENVNALEAPILIPCRSSAKLARMNQQLSRGFTSFWP